MTKDVREHKEIIEELIKYLSEVLQRSKEGDKHNPELYMCLDFQTTTLKQIQALKFALKALYKPDQCACEKPMPLTSRCARCDKKLRVQYKSNQEAVKVKISDKLYSAMFNALSPHDFDDNNPYDNDLKNYLGWKT